MGSRLNPMPPLPYDLLVQAADDLGRIESAYHAELLVSALLGSVYSVADSERGYALETFIAGFRDNLAHRAESVAPLLLAVVEALDTNPNRPDPSPQPPSVPNWGPHLGEVSCTAAYAYGDIYGDQVNYLTTFAYADPDLGGPDHVVSILVDRNLHIVKDLFVAAPAATVLDRLRSDAEEGDATVFSPIDPARVLPAVTPYLSVTDDRADLPDSDTFGADRAVALARLWSVSPSASSSSGQDDGPKQTAARLSAAAISEFRDAPEANRLIGAPGDAAALEFCLDLIARYSASGFDQDILRWSPTATRLFLLDWVPSNAVLDATDLALLPRVLDAWVRWCGRVRGLPPRVVATTVLTIPALRRSFVSRTRQGALRSRETQAVARMLAEGVDFDDDAAVESWIAAYNAENREDDQPPSD